MSVKQHISQFALVVRDYDEAIQFYTEKLGFELLEDTPLSSEKRWVVVRPVGGKGSAILLAKAKNEQQAFHIGNQTGGRVSFFLFTDDLDRDFQNLNAHNIEIVRQPEQADHGKVLVFADLYGNLWDLIEPSVANSLYNHMS